MILLCAHRCLSLFCLRASHPGLENRERTQAHWITSMLIYTGVHHFYVARCLLWIQSMVYILNITLLPSDLKYPRVNLAFNHTNKHWAKHIWRRDLCQRLWRTKLRRACPCSLRAWKISETRYSNVKFHEVIQKQLTHQEVSYSSLMDASKWQLLNGALT